MLDINGIRGDFPLLDRTVHGKPLVYLDSGATAQKPAVVIDRISALYREANANIHRGVHSLSEQMTSVYEAARETVRDFIHARSTKEIIFTSGATASINTVAHSFGEKYIGPGDNIVVSEMEHHSNIVPWQLVCERKGATLRVLPFDDEGYMLTDRLSKLIDGRTRIVAVTQASNVLGTMPDIRTICALAHSHGVPVLVDGCQGIVHGRTDVQQLGCDFYVFSGHKLYGPTGIGVLYGREEILETLPPYMGGGDMVSTVSFEKTTYAELPLRFEAGTANYIGAAGLAEAISYISAIPASDIADHEYSVYSAAYDALTRMPGLLVYGTTANKCPILSFTVEGTHPYDVGMILDKLGVAIRTGTHCAEPVMAHYGLTAMCRASFAIYNTVGEASTLAAAVERAAAMLR